MSKGESPFSKNGNTAIIATNSPDNHDKPKNPITSRSAHAANTSATAVRTPATSTPTRKSAARAKKTLSPSAEPHVNHTSNGHVTRQSLKDQQAMIVRLRDEASERARPIVKAGTAPIRVMARMVADLETACREQGISEELIASEVVNRTIGDVNLRKISPTDDGPQYVSLADDMGLALPGEVIGGRRSTGETYRWIRDCMLDFERQLLERRWDVRMYDINSVGNPLLREMLAEYAHEHWQPLLPPSQIYLSLGASDGLDKFFRAFSFIRQAAGHKETAVIFPAPGFNVPEWQARSAGLHLHRLTTRPEDHFKITPPMLHAALAEQKDIAALYLTVSNNPTAFSYSPEELQALFQVVTQAEREILIIADLAYIGTGVPEEDRARMTAFLSPEVLERSVLVCSLSKTHTLTGDRCGWVGFGNPKLAAAASVGWTNTTSALPADWQLRYMANMRLFHEHPELEQRVRDLYAHRRKRLGQQLVHINEQQQLFATVNLDDGGTVYNWSQLRPDADVFTLFGQTGIAGVPGSGFGYTDDFVRLSVGCIPVPAV